MAYQFATATFTGTEAHVDITWSTHYTSFALIGGSAATTDGSIVGIRLCNPSDPTLPPDNTGVRIEPTAPFSGTVTIINLDTT